MIRQNGGIITALSGHHRKTYWKQSITTQSLQVGNMQKKYIYKNISICKKYNCIYCLRKKSTRSNGIFVKARIWYLKN